MNNEVETVVAVIDSAPADVDRKLYNEVTAYEFFTEKMVVSSDKEFDEAGRFGRLLKSKMAEVSEFFSPMKKAAHDAHKQICAREKAMLEPLKRAEGILKKAMGAYALQKEQERKAAEEAARERAREEAERKLAESIEAESVGDEEAALMAMMDAEMAETAALSIVVEGENPTAKGVSNTEDWEIVSVDERLVPVDVDGITIRPVDTGAILRLIRASKGTIEIKGIQYQPTRKISFRR